MKLLILTRKFTEITESAFGTGCAQMSEAIVSAISFISAGLIKSSAGNKDLCNL